MSDDPASAERRTLDFVVPLEDKPYLQWQLKVMLASFERWRRKEQRIVVVIVGDEARLSRYMRATLERYQAPFLLAPVPDVLDIAKRPQHLAHQSYNKPYGVARLMASDVPLAQDLFVVDPDLIFLRDMDLTAWDGWLRATHVNFPGGEVWSRTLDQVLRACEVTREQVTTWIHGWPVDVGAEWLAPTEVWRRLAPEWARLSLRLQSDPDLQKDFGWTGDVTAGSMAAWKLGLRIDPMNGICWYNGGYPQAPESAQGWQYVLHYGYGNAIFEKRNIWHGLVDPSDGAHGAVIDAELLRRVRERRAICDVARLPATARTLDEITKALAEALP